MFPGGIERDQWHEMGKYLYIGQFLHKSNLKKNLPVKTTPFL